MPRVIAMIEQARRSGLRITADMYTYTAGATGLDASMPPWVLDGGCGEEAFKRLRDPGTRKKIATAIRTPSRDWENLFLAAGSPDRVLLVEFQVRGAQAADRQDAGGGSADARRGSSRRS